MKYYESTFKIKLVKDNEFRIKKISPIKLLSLATLFNDKNREAMEEIFTFALENMEVNILGQWFPVKEAGKEQYWPNGFEENVLAIQELVTYFAANVLTPIFTKSNKSEK